MYITRYYSQILIKGRPSLQIFDKYFNMKFHENPSSESRGLPCGRTDRRTEPHINRHDKVNRLTPNDPYMGRTAPLTSKCCILYIYSTNICTEYFKHALYSPFFSSKCNLFHNANLFSSCIIHILYTGCAKIKK
jgi:hypothetical protein